MVGVPGNIEGSFGICGHKYVVSSVSKFVHIFLSNTQLLGTSKIPDTCQVITWGDGRGRYLEVSMESGQERN